MRKSKWLVALFVSLLALTGCGKKEDFAEVLDASRKKMDELSNYAMKMEMKIGVKAEGIEMTLPVVVDAKIDAKSQTGEMTTSMQFMGMDISTQSYTQTVDGKTTTYTKEEMDDEEVWTKETSESATDYKQFVSITENSTDIQKKKSDDKNADYYQVTISKEQMQSLMKESSNLMGDSMDMEGYDIKNDVVVDVYVDKNSHYITKLGIDLKDVMSMDEMEAGVELTEASITISFSEFDKVGTITIPEDVIENAQEYSDDMENDSDIINPEV